MFLVIKTVCLAYWYRIKPVLLDLVSGLAPIPLGSSLFMLEKEKLELGEIREREGGERERER